MIYYCAEDELSRSVAIRLIETFCYGGIQTSELGGVYGGYGDIKRNLNKYCNLSLRSYVFIITDLDRAECCPSLRNAWLGSANITDPLPEKMLFCIAQREVESWLMADTGGISNLLQVSAGIMDDNIENNILDAKEYLVNLARRSRSADIRHGLVPSRRSQALTGLSYNQILVNFVKTEWDPRAASENSASLRRAVSKLSQVFMDPQA